MHWSSHSDVVDGWGLIASVIDWHCSCLQQASGGFAPGSLRTPVAEQQVALLHKKNPSKLHLHRFIRHNHPPLNTHSQNAVLGKPSVVK